MFVLGLMSGTSADGVDAVLVDFQGNLSAPKWRLINSAFIGYPKNLQQKIVDVGQGKRIKSDEWLLLAEEITEFHAIAAKSCDSAGEAKIIGCHGQTFSHRPPCKSLKGASLQIIQAPLLATLLGKPVIFDFRSKDLALGGQGAPLSPLLDHALIRGRSGWRGVLNLGGIANLSLLPPRLGPDRNQNLFGWDCGPANTLIDLAVQKLTNGCLMFDCNSEMALAGTPDINLIKEWLKEDYFHIVPPKSTGREKFGIEDLDRRLLEINSNNVNDVIATLTSFTAFIVAQELENFFEWKGIKPIELFVSGGGSKNPFLLKEIVSRCKGMRVLTLDKLGIPSQAREAMAFALLAWWYVHDKPCSPTITGAQKESVLGVLAKA